MVVSEENSWFEAIDRAVFDTSTLTGSYQVMNGSGFSDDIKELKIFNGSDTGVDVSYDGSTDHDFYPAGSTFILDIQANHATRATHGSGTKYGRKGQKIWGKGTAGTGNLYIIGYR